jgi:hypothetical protein
MGYAILEGMDSPSGPVSYPAVMEQRYRSRLPSSLSDLSGPAHGTVQLPLHVAWSGQTEFDLDHPKPRMHMYRIVLAEGQVGDVTTYLNRDLLLSQWPVLRTLISKTIRGVWETAFSELHQGQPMAPGGYRPTG